MFPERSQRVACVFSRLVIYEVRGRKRRGRCAVSLTLTLHSLFLLPHNRSFPRSPPLLSLLSIFYCSPPVAPGLLPTRGVRCTFPFASRAGSYSARRSPSLGSLFISRLGSRPPRRARDERIRAGTLTIPERRMRTAYPPRERLKG